ncbi:MAG: bifunctional UDP-3-O-[3-hydroxymyristoyl] N-acetylglucosamine deacetylase/3-hydroxyacyl-ACP dehydratase [Verrucomicrobiota bacterium]
MKQRTLGKDASVKGKALHTGQEVTLTLRPGAPDTGIVFRRIDLIGRPEVRPVSEMVTELERKTTVSSESVKLHTIEHVLSALSGMGVDNAVVELDASEPPIVDGSARPFTTLVHQCGLVNQDRDRETFALTHPITINEGSRSIIALPFDGLRITCTSADDRGIHTQHLTIDIDPETYASEIAPARTFTVYEDIENLLKKGLIQGGSLDSAILLKGDKIVSKEPLRFSDELVRHKILDIIGDIVLAGVRVKAHIIAVRPGHALNARLAAAIRQQWQDSRTAAKPRPAAKAGKVEAPISPVGNALDIRQILNALPHRYPFVMVDRVVELTDDSLVAIKNVTINEPYFQGHFPGQPIMPGVLQVEAMAQASGLIMLRRAKADEAPKVVFFMSADKVKFRKAVVPGDVLEIRAKLTKVRGRIAAAECECFVNGESVSSAELLFTIADSVNQD